LLPTLRPFSIHYSITNTHELLIKVFYLCHDRTPDSLLNLFLDEGSSEMLERLVQKTVLRMIADGKFEAVDFDDDCFEFEGGGFILVC